MSTNIRSTYVEVRILARPFKHGFAEIEFTAEIGLDPGVGKTTVMRRVAQALAGKRLSGIGLSLAVLVRGRRAQMPAVQLRVRGDVRESFQP